MSITSDDDRPTQASPTPTGPPRRRFDIGDLDLTGPRAATGADDADEKETKWATGPGVPAMPGERETKVFTPQPEELESVAWLYCRKGLRKGELHQLRKRRNEFGRAADCDFRIEDDFASGHHGAILLEDETWRAFDFASSNGTFINGRRIGREAPNPSDLSDGDVVAVGESEYVFKRI